MPPDNATTVAAGGDVNFPQNGIIANTDIGRVSLDSFVLAAGVYYVAFNVSICEAGQLVLTLNGQELDYTTVGRATGASQITGFALVNATVANSVLTVRNPAANATPLTVTPTAGGATPVSAQLVIVRIA
jgi:hypothetical protein